MNLRDMHPAIRLSKYPMKAPTPSVSWYLAGSISPSNCLAAFQPVGAADLAASYTNLASSGSTWDAAPGDAPSFGALGWSFDGASEHLIVGSGAIVSAAPLTIQVLWRVSGLTNPMVAMATVCDYSEASERIGMYLRGDVTNDPIAARAENVDAQETWGAKSTDTWYVGTAVHVSTTERHAYLNGDAVTKGSNTSEAILTGLDITVIAARAANSAIGLCAAITIGAIAFYDIAFSDDQASAGSAAMHALVA